MTNEVRVSAWSLRHRLGAISMPARESDGQIVWKSVTDANPDLPLRDVPGHLKAEFGVTEFEIPDWYLNIATEEERAALKDSLIREGSTITTVTVDGRYIGDGNDEYRDEDLAVIEDVLDLCAYFGVQSARVNVVPPPIVPRVSAANFDELVAALKRLASYSSERGIELLIENHGEHTSSKEEVDEFLNAVGDNLGFILDTGNIGPLMAEVGRSFVEGRQINDVTDLEPVYDFISSLIGSASIVHVKTYGFYPDGRSRVYDLQKVLDLLVTLKWEGPITIECAAFDKDEVYDAVRRTLDMINVTLGRTVSA